MYPSCELSRQIISPDGDYLNTLGTGCGSGDFEFNRPTGVAIDQDDNIYVADFFNHRIMIYDANFVFVEQVGETGDAIQSITTYSSSGSCIDPTGNSTLQILATTAPRNSTAICKADHDHWYW